MLRVLEADPGADLDHRQVGLAQEALRDLDPALEHVAVGRDARGALERLAERERRQPGGLGELGEAEIVGEPRLDQLDRG